MHADDTKAQRAVLVLPFEDERQGANAVDARIGPEVDENDVASKGCESNGSRSYPGLYTGQFRGRTVLERMRGVEKVIFGHDVQRVLVKPAVIGHYGGRDLRCLVIIG